MRGEFYIAQVMRWNPEALPAVCSMLDLDYHDPQQLLGQFRGDFALLSIAGRLDCDRDDVFVRLRERLARSMGVRGRARLVSLGPTDVSLFFQDEFVCRIAEALECSTQWPEIVARLFEAERLSGLLQRTGISAPDEQLPPDQLFWRMVSAEGVKKLFKYLGGPVDIWGLLAGLVNEEASGKLCDRFGCEPEEIFGAVRGAMENEASEEAAANVPEKESEKLDTLAVAKFQELFRAIGSTFLHEATAIAEKLRQGHDGDASVRMLLPLLHFYGKRAYREALHRAVSHTQSLGSLGFDPVRLSQQPCGAQMELRATITEAEEEAKTEEAVLVEFRVLPEGPWQPLVRLRGLTRSHREHVVSHLPHNAGGLQGVGDTLVERVLQCPLPALPSPERTAWNLMMEGNESLVQYFVLSNRRLPDVHGIGTIFGGEEDRLFDVAADVRTDCSTPKQLYERAVARCRQG